MEEILSYSDTINLLHRFAFRIERQSDQILFEKLGIGFSQYKILHALNKNPRYTQKQLASLLGQTEASVSRQIKIMRENGILSSSINPKNRREHLTLLSTKGLRIHEAAYESLEKYNKKLLENIDDKERKKLESILDKLYIHL